MDTGPYIGARHDDAARLQHSAGADRGSIADEHRRGISRSRQFLQQLNTQLVIAQRHKGRAARVQDGRVRVIAQTAHGIGGIVVQKIRAAPALVKEPVVQLGAKAAAPQNQRALCVKGNLKESHRYPSCWFMSGSAGSALGSSRLVRG